MPGCEDKELIKNVRGFRDERGNLLLSSICQRLQESGFNVAGTLVSYYSPIEEMYTFVAKDPIPSEKDGIPVENLNRNRLYLKFRPGGDSSPKGNYGSSLDQPSMMNPTNGKCSLLLTRCRTKCIIFYWRWYEQLRKR